MIVKRVELPCSPTKAFALFADRIDEWWPPERRHGSHPETVIVLRRDRFFEHDPTGTETELGRVKLWQPPLRIELEWFPGTGPDRPTDVQITFEPCDVGTRVEVRHGPGTAGEALYDSRAPRYAASWDIVLAAAASVAGNDD